MLGRGRNQLGTLRDIEALRPLRGLTNASFEDNPLSQLPDYRPFVVDSVPSLAVLDGSTVSREERVEATQRCELPDSSFHGASYEIGPDHLVTRILQV